MDSNQFGWISRPFGGEIHVAYWKKGIALWLGIFAAPLCGIAQSSLPDLFPFPNGSGLLQNHNASNQPIPLTGAFFQSLGTNGRSCGTCHRAAEGFSISAAEVSLRFFLTAGTDPIFRTNDGSNCDQNIDVSTLAGRIKAFSLLTSRGLIRIALSPPAGAQFTVTSVQNPYGCSSTQTLSMYRRPLPSTNLRFLSTVMWDGRESSTQTGTQKISLATNPGDLLADLAQQAIDATTGHAQGSVPTAAQLQDIVNFEMALTTAQGYDYLAGSLNSGGATGGPVTIASLPFYIGINDPLGNDKPGTKFSPAVFNLFSAWVQQGSGIQNSRRASIARGEALFNSTPINITGVAGLNDVLGVASIPGTCGTCHSTPNVGNHSFPLPINIGVGDTNSPLDVSYLPVFTIRNNATGEVVTTTDPGRALVTGLWADIGKLKGPILRGLAGRAPYFHNGSALTLNDVITFYNKRFNIGFTQQNQQDLVAFLSSL
jgi:cytochrome c peroxidase